MKRKLLLLLLPVLLTGCGTEHISKRIVTQSLGMTGDAQLTLYASEFSGGAVFFKSQTGIFFCSPTEFQTDTVTVKAERHILFSGFSVPVSGKRIVPGAFFTTEKFIPQSDHGIRFPLEGFFPQEISGFFAGKTKSSGSNTKK
jgi:hypothetical protein